MAHGTAAGGSSASRSRRSCCCCASGPPTATTCSSGCPRCSGEERVDVGNLYRVLRSLEEQGLVSSEWDESVPGPAKRTYELTEAGREALERWAASLAETRDRSTAFSNDTRKRR